MNYASVLDRAEQSRDDWEFVDQDEAAIIYPVCSIAERNHLLKVLIENATEMVRDLPDSIFYVGEDQYLKAVLTIYKKPYTPYE